MRGGYLVREARLRAGISQAELAKLMGTSQSLVARWENEQVSPRFEKVVRAVRACGLDLSLGLFNYDHQQDILIADQLRLSPEQRVKRMVDFVHDLRAMRGSAERIDG